jgi:N utilization substance protein B
MQGFYTYEKSPDTSIEKITANVMKSIQRFNTLLHFNLYLIESTCRYVIEYTNVLQNLRTRKVTQQELSKRILENPIIHFISHSDAVQQSRKVELFDNKIDSDIFKKYFFQLKDKESYKKYIQLDNQDTKDDYYILLELYNHIICADKDFDNMMEDIFPEWNDDKHHIKSLVADTLKQLAQKGTADIETGINKSDIEYTKLMVERYIHHHDEMLAHIKARLNNWDEERLAEVDLIILLMGVCEFLYQPEIPVKVTINEYLEIAKNYSTPKSSEFINGILDKVLKDLRDKNLVVKSGRGLIEN